MPRRERDRDLARRRKRKEKRRKLRAKGLLEPPVETVKGDQRKRPKKAEVKEPPPEKPKEMTGSAVSKPPEG